MGDEDFTPASVWRFLAPVVPVVLILLAFMPALDAVMVDWDDDDLLLHNTRYRTLNAENLRWMFTTSYGGHFQPLTWLTYSLDWALWKRETFGYHLTSVVLHALTAVAFYFIARRLLAVAVGGAGPWRASRSTPVVLSAALAAALFAAHPLRAESVAWLAERRDVLSGLLYLLSVWCYLRYASGLVGVSDQRLPVRASPSPRRLSYVGAVVLCAVSLLAKASAVTLPIVLLILDVYPLRRWNRTSWLRQPVPPARRIWIEKLPFLALALAAGIRAIVAQAEGGAFYSFARHDLWARLAQACYGLTFYLWKSIWPANLGPLYEIPSREVLFGPMLWASVVVVLAVGFAAVRLRRRWPMVTAALAVYLVMLLPVLGFAQSGPQLVADRYSYLSCLGLALLAGAALLRILQSDWWSRGKNRRAFLALVAVFVLVLLMRATYRQADIWLSARTLWARGVQVSPDSPIAHTNYADALVRAEFFAGAVRHYRRAIHLDANDSVALHHFADLQRRAGYTDSAIHYYLRALRIDPSRQRACFSLARLLVSKGRAREAVKVLRDGARRHPDALEMIDYLARLLSAHPDEHVRNGEEAVRRALYVNRARDFSQPHSLLTLATAYAEAGRFDEAVETGQRAIVLAEQNGNGPLANEFKRRLALFQEGKPYHFAN